MAVGYIANENMTVARGLTRGAYSVNKFGYNNAVGTTFETIWDGNNVYTYIASAGTATAASSDSGDNTGTVTVEGLDTNFNLVSETITIGGSAGSQSFYRIFRAFLVTHPTGSTNIGNITITADSKSAAIITAGKGQTLMALYTIPAGKKGYLHQLDVGSSKDLENEIQFLIKDNANGDVFQTKEFLTTRGGFIEKNFHFPVEIPEKHDIEVRAAASATSKISAGFELLVLDVPRVMGV